MPSFAIFFAHAFHLAPKSGPEVLNGSCDCRKLKLENCMFNKLAPNFSSLRNLESLTLTKDIEDLKTLQALDGLTQLTIHLQSGCNASLALVCPSNLLQLEISSHSYPAPNGLAIDKVCCRAFARFVALTRPA